MSSRPVPPLLLLFIAAAACVPGGGAPRVSPRGTLQPDEGGALRKEKGPFAVVSAGPTGETRDVPEISIAFSRPLRALDGAPPPPPVKMTPQVPGTWDWVGSRALRFSPEKPLPMATTFEVEVAGARAIDGSTLAEPYRFSFSTPRPRLVGSQPYNGSEGLKQDATVRLDFNQPVDDASVRASVSFARKADGQPVAYDISRPAPGDLRRAVLVPRSPLAVHSEFLVRVDEKLRGVEGPLPSGRESALKFHTYGPLKAAFDCGRDRDGRCRPGGWMAVRASNPVPRGELKKLIQIEPAVKMSWPSLENDKAMVGSLPLDGAFLPGRRYTVRVRAGGAKGLKDAHGQPLLAGLEERFEVGDLPSAFNVGVSGQILEPSELREVPLFAMNLDGAEVAAAALDVAAVVAMEGQNEGEVVDQLLGNDKAKKVSVRPSAGRNRVHRQGLRVDPLLPHGRGPVAIGARSFSGKNSSSQLRVVQVTDLGVSAKVSGQESLVWVTRLSTGAPVEGAAVEAYKPGEARPSATVKTDSSGLARFGAGVFVRPEPQGEEGERKGGLIVAREGNDWTYIRSNDELYGWRYGASIEPSGKAPSLGLLFTERGLYRPGEQVKLKGLARLGTTKGMSTPAGQKVHVSVAGPEGEKVSEFDATLSQFGSFTADVALPLGGKLGSYQVLATMGDKKAEKRTSRHGEDDEEAPEGWSTSFSVAEYRPAEFKAAAEINKTSFIRGDEIACVGRGTYLFGAPMAGSGAQIHLSYGPSYFSPPGLSGFSTGDEAYLGEHPEAGSRGGELKSGEGKLDAQGESTLKGKLELPGQGGPSLVTCEAEITDLSRQTFAGSTTALVHPGELYAAMRVDRGEFVDAGSTVRVEALAVQPDGKRRGGVPVEVTLFERVYGVARQAAGEGRVHTSSTVSDREVGSCKVTSGASPAACELKVPRGGHFIARASLADARGNKVSSSQHIYAIGGSGGGWRDQDDGAVKLVTDKKTYRPGDTARVLIQSPFPQAEALVTVEREGVLWQKTQKISGPTPTVDIPVTEALMPNAFVSVTLLRGRTKKAPDKDGAPDVGAPAFRLGYAPLVVDTSSRRLKVEVKPAKGELHPGEDLVVDLGVTDAAGKGARTEVTLYAVDEGVLMLTGYRTPDPVQTFFAARGIQVHTLESRESMARIARTDSGVAMGLDKGLDGGGGGLGNARNDFRQTAYFNPAIVTDEGGRARVSFKLPDGLSTYRLMAVAAGADDRFGSAEAQVITSKPIMARPALPRVLRAGDRFDASVVLSSKGASGRFEVALAAEGLALSGDSRRTVDLAVGQSQEVRFSASAPRVGRAKLRFDVKGEGASDAVEVSREVLSPMLMEASALYGDTDGAAGEQLGDMSSLRDDVGGLEVSLSPTALAGLAGGVEQLIEYPYGCTEQLTSRLVPLLPLRDLADTLGLKLPDKVDEAVRATVGKVSKNQQADGSFGLWPESSAGYPWLTAYALWGLNEAQRRGFPVRQSVVAAATRYLRKELGEQAARPHQLAERAFVLDVLADSGDPDPGAAEGLFAAREQLPLFAKAQLLHALAIARGNPSMISRLTSEIEGSLRFDGPRASVFATDSDEFSALLDSNTRTSAMVLRALVAASPSHQAAPKLALGLLHARRGGRWRSTQETAWALLALDAYRRAQEAAEPSFHARVFLGQALLAETQFQGRQKLAFQSQTPMGALAASSGQVLAFDKQGQGHLFYEARLRFARKKLPQHPIESGFFIDKGTRVVTPQSMVEAMKSSARGVVTQLTAGDLVMVNLTVEAPSGRDFVVLDDPLPAGLEAIDTSLAGASSWARDGEVAPVDDSGDEHDYRWSWEAPVTRRELRDDRVLFFIDHMEPGVHRFRYLARATTLGSFLAPPTRVEEMYTPETFGQTAAATVTVSPRP